MKMIELQKELSQLEVDRKNKIEAAMRARIAEQEVVLKAGLIRTQAQLDTESEIIDGQYNQNKISLEKYFDERAAIIIRRIQAELAVLRNAVVSEDDESKKTMLNAQVFAKEQELERSLMGLQNEKLSEQKKIDDKILSQQQKTNDLKIKAEEVFQNQVQRIKVLEDTQGMSSQFQKELIDLQAQQQRQQKLYINQNIRLKEYELDNLKQLAGGTADLFDNLYELLGKQNKELFYAAKAAAIAVAVINIAHGVTKAI